MFKTASAERNPFSSLILLLLLIFAGAVLFTGIAFAIGISIYGAETMHQLSEGDSSNLDFIKMIQIISSTGMFVIPALIYAKLQNKDWLGIP
jgi:hypothetical protein